MPSTFHRHGFTFTRLNARTWLVTFEGGHFARVSDSAAAIAFNHR